jgi:hypothetical protein
LVPIAAPAAPKILVKGPPVIKTPKTTPTPPLVPEAAETSDTTIQVTWNKPNDNGASISGYVVQYRKSSEPHHPWDDAPSVNDGDELTLEISGLEPSTEYAVRVAAVNSVGTSEFSREAAASTLCPVKLEAAPDVPLVPEAEGSSHTTIHVTWEKPNDNGVSISGYVVQYLRANESDWTDAPSVNVDGGDVLTLKLSGRNPSTEYAVRICAINSMGSSDFSDRATATTQAVPIVKPAAPKIVGFAGLYCFGLY